MSLMWTEDLPQKVKVLAFSYLSLADRKTIRLVCKNWYDVSWSRDLCSGDRVDIGPYTCAGQADRTPQYIDALERLISTFVVRQSYNNNNDSSKPINFRFHTLKLGSTLTEKKFWRWFGGSIVCLEVFGCRVSEDALLAILNNCASLETLKLDGTVYIPSKFPRGSLAVIAQNLSKLRRFSFIFDNGRGKGDWSGGSPVTLFLQFPHLKEFSVEVNAGNLMDVEFLSESIELCSSEAVFIKVYITAKSAREFDAVIISNDRLVLKGFHVICSEIEDNLTAMFLNIVRLHAGSLEQLGLHFIFSSCTASDGKPNVFKSMEDFASFVRILSHFSNLRKLVIRIDDGFSTTVTDQCSELVRELMHRLPSLTSLHLEDYSCRPPLFSDASNGISPSQFKEQCQIQEYPFQNWPHLRELAIFNFSDSSQILNALKCYTILKSLVTLTLEDIDDINDRTMKLICRELVSLMKLEVKHCAHVSDLGLTSSCAEQDLADGEIGPGIGNLRELRELLLCGRFGAQTVAEIRFEKLHTLTLIVSDICDESLLAIAVQNLQLETFSFHRIDQSVEFVNVTRHGVRKFLRIARRLTRLTCGMTFNSKQRERLGSCSSKLKNVNGNAF